jgi:hypothetical protein
MGIRLVMGGVMLVSRFAFMVVVVMPIRMGHITVGMAGTRVGKERKRPLSPNPMVNQHMRRGTEKSENDAEGEQAHSG